MSGDTTTTPAAVEAPKPTKISLAREMLKRLKAEDLPEGVSLRKQFIAQAQAEIGISEGCAVTYYSNLQNEAKGLGLYAYSNRKSKTVAEAQSTGEESAEAVEEATEETAATEDSADTEAESEESKD